MLSKRKHIRILSSITQPNTMVDQQFEDLIHHTLIDKEEKKETFQNTSTSNNRKKDQWNYKKKDVPSNYIREIQNWKHEQIINVNLPLVLFSSSVSVLHLNPYVLFRFYP